jgi:hypothetical protein
MIKDVCFNNPRLGRARRKHHTALLLRARISAGAEAQRIFELDVRQ